jgi:hypothetical protein
MQYVWCFVLQPRHFVEGYAILKVAISEERKFSRAVACGVNGTELIHFLGSVEASVPLLSQRHEMGCY